MILVFGSINADLIFAMDALPAPGQTLLANELRTEPGGKGANQAIAARRAGAEVLMAGAVGRDLLADVALANLRADGVDISRVKFLDASTGCASICTDVAGRNQIVVAPGASALAQAAQIDDATLSRATWLVLQGESDSREIETLIARANETACQVLLNLAPAIALSEHALRNVNLLVVNEDEAATIASRFDCEASAKGLHIALGIDVIRTLGADGAEAATLDGLFHVPAQKITPIDTTAAGDCFVGVLAACLDRDEPLVMAMRNAGAAAAQACLARGSQGSLPRK